jgi:nucleoid DNA-binding protein
MAKAAKKAPTKTEVLQNIADATNLTKKQVSAVLDALNEEVRKSLSNRGSGVFTLPGLKDREEESSCPSRSKGREEPIHRRVARSACQAGLQQGEGSRLAESQGTGQVVKIVAFCFFSTRRRLASRSSATPRYRDIRGRAAFFTD